MRYRHRSHLLFLTALALIAPHLSHAQYRFSEDGKLAEISSENTTGDIVFYIDGVEKSRVDAQGRVITQGGVQVGEETLCDHASEGTIIYKSASNMWKFCDGIAWQDFMAASSTCRVRMTAPLFSNLTDQPLNTLTESDIIKIETDTCEAPLSATGDGNPEYRVCADALCTSVLQPWIALPMTIENGQYVQLRLTSSTAPDTLHQSSLLVSNAYITWSVRTLPPAKTVFVTSTAYMGSAIGGLGGADHHCNARAAAAGLSGRYMAWLTDSTAGTAPASRFDQATIPYKLPTGTTTANNWADLIDSTLTTSINRDEFGALVASGKAWTNTAPNGTRQSTNSCNDWSDDLLVGVTGTTNMVNSSWTNNATELCLNASRLYCVQQDDDIPGLAGTDYKRIFITSGTYDGAAVNGITGADTKCNARAAAAGLSGTYKAWLSDSTAASAPAHATRGFTKASIPYRLVNGRRVANNWTDLTDGVLKTGIVYDETGAFVNSANAWTNTAADGSMKSAAGHCGNWANNFLTVSSVGLSGSAGAGWSDHALGILCALPQRLICVEQ